MTQPPTDSVFPLTVHRTYYDKGFFNVRVEYDDLVRKTDGPIDILLEPEGQVIEGLIDRRANSNGTARILGRVALRDWFHRHCTPGDVVHVDLSSRSRIGISKPP